MYAPLIPPQANPPVNTVVTVFVRVYGRTLGGMEIESNELAFPIAICEGCLVSFPLDADNPATPEYDCTSFDIASSVGGGSLPSPDDQPCWLGQDAYTDCRYCAGSHPEVCTAPSN
jgi:hypothetical protein